MAAIDVFISYSTQDKPTADATCATLEAAGVRCWIAPRDIRPGMTWAASIVRALDTCRVMVLIFSKNANESPQIRREVDRAMGKGIPVVPLRIENIVPTDELEFFMSSVHWLDAWTPPLDQHLKSLASAVKAFLEADLSKPTGPRNSNQIVQLAEESTEPVEPSVSLHDQSGSETNSASAEPSAILPTPAIVPEQPTPADTVPRSGDPPSAETNLKRAPNAQTSEAPEGREGKPSNLNRFIGMLLMFTGAISLGILIYSALNVRSSAFSNPVFLFNYFLIAMFSIASIVIGLALKNFRQRAPFWTLLLCMFGLLHEAYIVAITLPAVSRFPTTTLIIYLVFGRLMHLGTYGFTLVTWRKLGVRPR